MEIEYLSSKDSGHLNEDSQEVTVILFGRTGAGKSSLGNKMAGKNFFEVGQTLHSLTDKAIAQICHLKQLPIKIKIIDTPGFADNKETLTASEILSNILLFLKELKNGFNIGIFCLPVNTRVDAHDIHEIELLSLLLGQDVFKHTIIAVTRGNTIKETERMETYKKYPIELPKVLLNHGLGNLGSEKILFADFDHFDELFMTPFIEILRNTPSYMPQIAKDMNSEDPDSIERFLTTPQMQAVCSKYESMLDEQRKQIEQITTEYKLMKQENDKIIALNEHKQTEFRKNIENCNKRIAEFEENKQHMQMMYNALKYEQVRKLNELNKIIEDHQRNIEYMQTIIVEKERELQSCAQKMDELCKAREAAKALCDKQEKKSLGSFLSRILKF